MPMPAMVADEQDQSKDHDQSKDGGRTLKSRTPWSAANAVPSEIIPSAGLPGRGFVKRPLRPYSASAVGRSRPASAKDRFAQLTHSSNRPGSGDENDVVTEIRRRRLLVRRGKVRLWDLEHRQVAVERAPVLFACIMRGWR